MFEVIKVKFGDKSDVIYYNKMRVSDCGANACIEIKCRVTYLRKNTISLTAHSFTYYFTFCYPFSIRIGVQPLCHYAPAENEIYICDLAVTSSEIDF